MEYDSSRNDDRTVCCVADSCFELNSYLNSVDCAYLGGTMHNSGGVGSDDVVSHSEYLD